METAAPTTDERGLQQAIDQVKRGQVVVVQLDDIHAMIRQLEAGDLQAVAETLTVLRNAAEHGSQSPGVEQQSRPATVSPDRE